MPGEGSRRREVAVFCSYVPLEIIEAAGFRPRMVSGLEADNPASALPVNLCPYVRCSASFLTGPGARDLAGVVLTDSCYPMQRLWDFVLERTTFPLKRFVRVPRLRSPEAATFYRGELDRLARGLAEDGGLPHDPERLRATVALYNHSRTLNGELTALMLQGRRPGLAAFLSSVHTRAYHLPREEFNLLMEERLRKEQAVRGEKSSTGLRLMLAGSFFIHAELIDILENLGARVVALDSCAHDRLGTTLIDPQGGDLLQSLALGYLGKPPCPRMRSSREHIAQMARLASGEHFDGVVYLLMKFCTPHAYNVPLWREAMRRAGVRMMVLETEGGNWSQPRVLTRLEAFIESLRTSTDERPGD